MIARVKATGRFIDVIPYGDEYAQLFPEGDFKVYTKDELDFRVDIDWQHYRIQAAIAAMQIVADKNRSVRDQHEQHLIAIYSVELADALIAELQKKQD